MPPSSDGKATRAAPGPVMPDLPTTPHHENALQHLPDHPTGPPRLGNPISTPTPPKGNGQAGTPTRGSHPSSADLLARPQAPPTPMTPQPRSTGSPPTPIRVSHTLGGGIPKTCSCPARAPPPPRPTSLPFPPTEANQGRLEQHLLSLYAASSFNICEHQQMSGPPPEPEH